MSNVDDQLRYPIGKFAPQPTYTSQELESCIRRIEAVPSKIEDVFRSLSPKQLETPYREGGWTARQVIHHIADSHSNAYIRVKWTLTEETPLIKAYDEKLWADTPEIQIDPAISVQLLKALHVKLTALLRLIKPEDLTKAFVHPETKKQVPLDRMIATYAWHGEHHLGHLKIIACK
jgi:hypothetical protein